MKPPPFQQQLTESTALARLVAEGADSRAVSSAVSSRFKQIYSALSPILGDQGVSALLVRSVALASSAHPWLGATFQGLPRDADLSAVEALFTHRAAAEVAAGGGAVLDVFHSLLASLIGLPLTEELLGPSLAR